MNIDLAALRALEREREIPFDTILAAIETALLTAYRHTDGAQGLINRVVGYDEKPELSYMVSMGVYALEPEAIEHVPAGRYYDLPDLVLALLAAGAPR